MIRHDYTNVVILTADKGKYLRLAGVDNSEELIGRPERLILDSTGKIPEYEEVDKPEKADEAKVENVVEEKPAKKPRKTTKSTKK